MKFLSLHAVESKCLQASALFGLALEKTNSKEKNYRTNFRKPINTSVKYGSIHSSPVIASFVIYKFKNQCFFSYSKK